MSVGILAFGRCIRRFLFRFLCLSLSYSPSLSLVVASIQHFPESQSRPELMALLVLTSFSDTQDTVHPIPKAVLDHATAAFILSFPKLITSQVPGGSKNNGVSESIDKTGSPIPAPDLQIPLPLKNQTPSCFCPIWASLWLSPPPLLKVSILFLVHENINLDFWP